MQKQNYSWVHKTLLEQAALDTLQHPMGAKQTCMVGVLELRGANTT